MTALRLRERQLQQHSSVNQENNELLNAKEKLLHSLRYISDLPFCLKKMCLEHRVTNIFHS